VIPLVEIEGLHKRFRVVKGFWGFFHPAWRTVLAGIDLRLCAGEVVGLGGANGSGKTTLLKTVAGLLAPTQGGVRLAPAGGRRAVVGMTVADSRSFYWRLTGRQNLVFFAALWGLHGGQAAARIEEVAGRLGLAERLDEPVQALSSGLMQRLAIARTLLAAPDVWLLDEATRELDRAGREAVYGALEALRARGGAALFVSHDGPELERVSDRVVTLRAGRIEGGDGGEPC
jgi:ABC-2 type transport system ATP-binding protein